MRLVTNFSTYSYRRVDVRICTAKAYEKSFLLFWRTKSGFSMVAVRAKSTANVAEPDLPLSCTVTVPMCAKPIARSAGLFGVHFALRRSTCRRTIPFYSGKKVQSKPTRGPSISHADIIETWPVYCSFKHSDTLQNNHW